jgi:hypothetical protein
MDEKACMGAVRQDWMYGKACVFGVAQDCLDEKACFEKSGTMLSMLVWSEDRIV